MLSQSQINTFHHDGLLIVRGMFDHYEVETLRVVIQGLRYEVIPTHHNGGVNAKAGNLPTARCGLTSLHHRSPQIRRAAAKPELLEAVGQCLGHPFLLMNACMITQSPPSLSVFALRQEPPYNDPVRRLTFDVPNFLLDLCLHPASPYTDGLWCLPGYHLVGHVDLEEFSQAQLADQIMPLHMEPGDILIRAASTPYGSALKRGSSVRSVLSLHYAARDAVNDGYTPDWKYPPPAEATKLAESYLRLRRCESQSAHIRVVDDGFCFTGTPVTPQRHWRAPVDQVSGSLPTSGHVPGQVAIKERRFGYA